MARKKVVTSVSINPYLFDVWKKKMKITLSELVEKAIIDYSNPEIERQHLRQQVDERYKEIDELMARIDDLEKTENKVRNSILEEFQSKFLDEYRMLGTVPDYKLKGYCRRLGMTEDELEKLLEEELIK